MSLNVFSTFSLHTKKKGRSLVRQQDTLQLESQSFTQLQVCAHRTVLRTCNREYITGKAVEIGKLDLRRSQVSKSESSEEDSRILRAHPKGDAQACAGQ